MFFDTKQKILFAAAVGFFLFAGAATVARISRKPDLKALPADMQKMVPLQAPLLIEDDAGVSAE
jgi:hypothetical protein